MIIVSFPFICGGRIREEMNGANSYHSFKNEKEKATTIW